MRSRYNMKKAYQMKRQQKIYIAITVVDIYINDKAEVDIRSKNHKQVEDEKAELDRYKMKKCRSG